MEDFLSDLSDRKSSVGGGELCPMKLDVATYKLRSTTNARRTLIFMLKCTVYPGVNVQLFEVYHKL